MTSVVQPCNLKGGGVVCCAAASRQGANSMNMGRGQLQEERKTMRRWYKVSGPRRGIPGGITGPPSMLFDRQRIMGDAIAPHAARSRMDGQRSPRMLVTRHDPNGRSKESTHGLTKEFVTRRLWPAGLDTDPRESMPLFMLVAFEGLTLDAPERPPLSPPSPPSPYLSRTTTV